MNVYSMLTEELTHTLQNRTKQKRVHLQTHPPPHGCLDVVPSGRLLSSRPPVLPIEGNVGTITRCRRSIPNRKRRLTFEDLRALTSKCRRKERASYYEPCIVYKLFIKNISIYLLNPQLIHA